MMSIYYLERFYGIGQRWQYDETQSAVIVAASADHARQLAHDEFGREGSGTGVWLNPLDTTCDLLGTLSPGARTAGVVCRDFLAG